MATWPDHGPPWQRLLDVLHDRRVELTTDIRRRMQRELPAYRELAAESFEPHVAMAVESTLRLAGSPDRALTEEQAAVLERVGESQARLGIPVEAMLLAWRIGAELLVERGGEEAGRLGVSDAQQLVFVRSALSSSDEGMITTARGHRRIELERDRETQDRRVSFVRAVLFGTAPAAELRERAASYRLDPSRRYVAVRARPPDELGWPDLRRALRLDRAVPEAGMSALVDGDLAGLLPARPGDVGPARAGVGPALPLDRLDESFRLATRALETMRAFGLTGTRDLAALGLRPAVVADADVGEALRERYLVPLEGSGSGAEIAATLRAYLAEGGHVETAADRLHIHPNTLRYRLARFEELAGVGLREPQVAFELWWALERAASTPGPGPLEPGPKRPG